MSNIDKIEYIIEQLTKGGSRSVRLSNKFNISKKDLPVLKSIHAELKLSGEVALGSVDASKLISEGADDAFDTAIVNKILESTGNHGLGEFKDSNLANISDVENIGGVKSKQIFKQSRGNVPRKVGDLETTVSRGLSDIQADIDIGKQLRRGYTPMLKDISTGGARPSFVEKYVPVYKSLNDFSDNELRLTKQYFTAKNKGLSDKLALKVTKSSISRMLRTSGTDISKTLPSVGDSALTKAVEAANQATQDLEYLQRESGLYDDKYYGPVDSHVKEYNLIKTANDSNIGKQMPFASSAEIKEYNKMVQDFDKVDLSTETKRAQKLSKSLEESQTNIMEQGKGGLLEGQAFGTQTKPMVTENFGDMKIGGGFKTKTEEDLEAAAKIEYEKAYGDNTIPINFKHPTAAENKTIKEMGFNVGDKLPVGIDKKGNSIFLKVGPQVDEASPIGTGITSFGTDKTSGVRYDSDVQAERASKKQPGRIEIYDKTKREYKPKQTYVPSAIDESTPRISKAEYKTQQSLVGQMNQLKAMYPNVANKNNLVRLAVRNMEKEYGLPVNKKLLLNLSKFF